MENIQKGFTEEEKVVLLNTLKDSALGKSQLHQALSQEMLIKEMSIILTPLFKGNLVNM